MDASSELNCAGASMLLLLGTPTSGSSIMPVLALAGTRLSLRLVHLLVELYLSILGYVRHQYETFGVVEARLRLETARRAVATSQRRQRRNGQRKEHAIGWYVISPLAAGREATLRVREWVANTTGIRWLQAVYTLMPRHFSAVWRRSNSLEPPTSQAQLLEALPEPDLVPRHIGVVFTLEPLVVPRPGEPPQTYAWEGLTAGPKSRRMQRSLGERTEYLVLERAHATAERVRVYIELARLVAWSAAAGVQTLTVHEENGRLWDHLAELGSVVEGELHTLVRDPRGGLLARLVHQRTGESVTVWGRPVPLAEREQREGSCTLQGYTSTLGLSSPDSLRANTFGLPSLTVYLTSRAEMTAKVITVVREAHYGASAPLPQRLSNALAQFTTPNLILRAGEHRYGVQRLNGYPVFNEGAPNGDSPVWYARAEPFGFAFFLRGIHAYAREQPRPLPLP